jgi:hypothetical protein
MDKNAVKLIRPLVDWNWVQNKKAIKLSSDYPMFKRVVKVGLSSKEVGPEIWASMARGSTIPLKGEWIQKPADYQIIREYGGSSPEPPIRVPRQEPYHAVPYQYPDSKIQCRGYHQRDPPLEQQPDSKVVMIRPPIRVWKDQSIREYLRTLTLSPEQGDDYLAAQNALDYSRLLWVVGIEKKDIENIFNSLCNYPTHYQQEFVNLLADEALEVFLRIRENKRFVGWKLEQLYAVYSARRALRAPPALEHPMENLRALFYKSGVKDRYDDYLHHFNSAFNDLNPILRAYMKPHDSFKACIERKQALGGFNWVTASLVQERMIARGEYPTSSKWSENREFRKLQELEIEYEQLYDHFIQVRRLYHATQNEFFWNLMNKILGDRESILCKIDPLKYELRVHLSDAKELPLGAQQLLRIAEKQADKYLEILEIALEYILTPGYKPELYAIDLPERGGKHRIPLIPEWASGIVAGFMGEILKPTLDNINKSTFRGDNIRNQGRKNLYYSVDFSGGTDNFEWGPVRALWKIVLDRTEFPKWLRHLKKPLNEVIDKLIGPHLVFEDEGRLEAIREFVEGNYTDEFQFPQKYLKYCKSKALRNSVMKGKPPLIPRGYNYGVFRKASYLKEGFTEIGFDKERLFRRREMFQQPIALMNGGKVTKRGIQMCYGLSFPSLSWIVFICHYRINRRMNTFGVHEQYTQYHNKGDDNVSAHDSKQTIEELRRYHGETGAVTHQRKTKISSHGFIIAEVWYYWEGKELKSISQPKLKVLCPEQLPNTWLTQPQAVYKLYQKVDQGLRQKAMEHIWRSHERKYRSLLKLGIDIFSTPREPLFPMKFAPSPPNKLVNPLRQKGEKEINMLFQEPTYQRHSDTLVEYTHWKDYGEHPTNFLPMMDETDYYGQPMAVKEEDFKNLSMTWRRIPGWISGKPPEKGQTLKFHMIKKRWDLLQPGGGHLNKWPPKEIFIDQMITTSLFSLAKGKELLPRKDRRWLKDEPLNPNKTTLFIDLNNVWPEWPKYRTYEICWAIREYIRQYRPEVNVFLIFVDYFMKERMWEENKFQFYWIKPFEGNADKTILSMCKAYKRGRPQLWSKDRLLAKGFRTICPKAIILGDEYSLDDETFKYPEQTGIFSEVPRSALLGIRQTPVYRSHKWKTRRKEFESEVRELRTGILYGKDYAPRAASEEVQADTSSEGENKKEKKKKNKK